MALDLTNKTFGLLTVRQMLPESRALCDCECGNSVVKLAHDVKTGHTSSCGCAKNRWISEKRATHGDSRTSGRAPEYGCWRAMLARCFDQNNQKFHRYGQRGVTVYPEWRTDYQNFLLDVGRRPGPEYSLGRIDNDNGYQPGNVRWETRIQQARNTSTNRLATAFGETMSIAAWAEKSGKPARLISKRLRLGWTPERAISSPVESVAERVLRARKDAARQGNKVGINASSISASR